jgi:hypothetical protein
MRARLRVGEQGVDGEGVLLYGLGDIESVDGMGYVAETAVLVFMIVIMNTFGFGFVRMIVVVGMLVIVGVLMIVSMPVVMRMFMAMSVFVVIVGMPIVMRVLMVVSVGMLIVMRMFVRVFVNVRMIMVAYMVAI